MVHMSHPFHLDQQCLLFWACIFSLQFNPLIIRKWNSSVIKRVHLIIHGKVNEELLTSNCPFHFTCLALTSFFFSRYHILQKGEGDPIVPKGVHKVFLRKHSNQLKAGHHQSTSLMPFKWYFVGWQMMAQH